MIKIKNVKKSFGSNQVLKDVSLTVEKGQTAVILGASGSGKTTLLRTVNFLERADEGFLEIDGETVDLKKAKRKKVLEIRRKTAFVFQNYSLFANKTALQNVTEGLIIARKVPKDKAIKKAKEVLDWVGLSDKYDSYPIELSGGQQQRVGIARALVLEPKVILFDEPTSALDPELVGETLAVIKKVAGLGITMIIVTHEMSFAKDVANKVVFMAEGRIIEEGAPDQIFTNPNDERTRAFLRRIIPPEYNI